MQTSSYNIIAPWDSIKCVHNWGATEYDFHTEVKSNPSFTDVIDQYIGDIMIFLVVYIVFIGSLTFSRYGITNKEKNKSIEEI